MEIVNLNKKVYVKNQYEKVIDTKFSQLASTPSSTSITPTISVDEFFQYYNQLFFQIPKEGETNSHEYLIKTSSEYINFAPINEDIQALIEEINALQTQNLELSQQLVDLKISLPTPSSSSMDANAAATAAVDERAANIAALNSDRGTLQAQKGRG